MKWFKRSWNKGKTKKLEIVKSEKRACSPDKDTTEKLIHNLKQYKTSTIQWS